MALKTLTVLFLIQVMYSWQSVFGCPQGKVGDVVLFLDNSPTLSDTQFETQIQRAEQIVRLFRNFKNNDERRNHFNRIAIVTISDSTIRHVVKFKNPLNSSQHPNTDELVHILRKLHKSNESDSTSDSRSRRGQVLALKQLKRLSSQMRKEVAHVAFYFSNDDAVNRIDIKRAKFIRRLGIYLYIFRLGPSQITYDQYKKMVNEPVSDFVFDIKSHSDIDASVKKLLDMTHCDMQVMPPEEGPRPICTAKRPVNLFFGIDPITLAGSMSRKIQYFVESLKNETEESNEGKFVFEEVYNEFDQETFGKGRRLPDYSDLLLKINRTAASLSQSEGDRRYAQNTVLLFLDSNTYETKEMISRANYLKNHKMEIYAIVFGKSGTTFSDIVSKPIMDHLLQIEDAEQLTSHKEEILKFICKGW